MNISRIEGKLRWKFSSTLVCAVILVLFITAASQTVFGNNEEQYIEARTERGERVLLYPSMQWEFDKPDVRNLYWGMSKEQVIETETKRLIHDGDMLMGIHVSAFHMTGLLFLEFEQNKLSLAGYLFVESHQDPDDYINDYRLVVSALSEIYGEPELEVVEWKDDSSKEKSPGLGASFLQGDVELRSEWSTERTNIGCGLVHDSNLFGLLVGFEMQR